MRIGVISVVQETNTFAAVPTTLADFERQGLAEGAAAAALVAGTNTELAGALEALAAAGPMVEAVPLLRAWAMSGGVLDRAALRALGDRVEATIRAAGALDGLVLSLHGALTAEDEPDADAWLMGRARAALGDGPPIGVCLDLHANVTPAMVAAATFLAGYHTYPHVDQAATGARAARLVVETVAGRLAPATVLAKRALLLPAETTPTSDGPMARVRRLADHLTTGPVLDVSIFPVQPWLDVPELGLGVTVTVDTTAAAGGPDATPDAATHVATAIADDLADLLWDLRDTFAVELTAPDAAIAAARGRPRGAGPLLLSESADSPTAGAAADSPAMVEALLRHGQDLRAIVTLVDPAAVEACLVTGVGERVELRVGATLDPRFHKPVALAGRVDGAGAGPVRLAGPSFTNMTVDLGRWAVVTSGSLSVLLTERPAPTFDPSAYRAAGLRPETADLVVVRSATLFRAGWAEVSRDALILDLPGASTPRLDRLTFQRAPRPLHPVDRAMA
ncbi:MAG: M81 family metallopeptidase [Chloroflexota bacterium]